MRIAMIALGSQGDVQPYIALGKGLKAAGHAVRLLTHENYAELVSAHGLEFCLMPGDVQELIESQEMRDLLARGNFLEITARTAKEAQQAAVHWAQAGLVACQDMDLLVAGVGGLNLAIALAEKFAIPLVQAYVFPFTPTTAFPGVLFPRLIARFGGWVNWLSHQLVRQILWQGARTGDTLARKQILNLPAPPLFGSYQSTCLDRYPILYGFSPCVIPKPADWHNTQVTGYWFLDAAPHWTPPAALLEFLENGSPPVYVGFGSMGSRDPKETAELVLSAIERSQQRAILLAGWGGLRTENLPNHIYLVDSIPHAWLFPRVAAVVHHGGAGTTAAGLRAGVPTIVIPFFGDQRFWGQRVASLGVGTEPIPRKQLTAQRLAQAIQTAVTDPTIRQRASNLGGKIQAEDGIANAVTTIQNISELSRAVS